MTTTTAPRGGYCTICDDGFFYELLALHTRRVHMPKPAPPNPTVGDGDLVRVAGLDSGVRYRVRAVEELEVAPGLSVTAAVIAPEPPDGRKSFAATISMLITVERAAVRETQPHV